MSDKCDYEKLLEKIIQSDSVIRFVAICTSFGNIEHKLQRDDKTILLNEYDTDKLVREGVSSWHYRKQLSHKIGKGLYAMAVYEKITRITISHFISSLSIASPKKATFNAISVVSY